jgi:hypothetical protein
MKSDLQLLAPVLLLVVLAGAGCTAKQALVGISPDKVDQIEIGTDRATVEDRVDSVESEVSCTAGAKVDYVYDRGLPHAPYPVLTGPLALAVSAYYLGALEVIGACQIACQNGILEVTYDSDGKVVAVNPKPRSYDAGSFCDEGRMRSVCANVRTKATKTDLARRLRAAEEKVRATGCSPSFAGVVQTPRETPAELKARADDGDVEAMYEYGFRLNVSNSALNGSTTAWPWFCSAAHGGHAKAQFMLASYYRWGNSPVQKSLVKSYLWRTLSLNEIGMRALNEKNRNEQEMTADQIAEAERLVAKWKPNPAECVREAKLAAD